MRRLRRADPRTKKRVLPVRRGPRAPDEPVEDTEGNMPLVKPVVLRDPATAPGADSDTELDPT